MKTVHELTELELNELRESYFQQLTDTDPEALGTDIVEAEQIPMSDVVSHFEGIGFTDEDFFCNL